MLKKVQKQITYFPADDAIGKKGNCMIFDQAWRTILESTNKYYNGSLVSANIRWWFDVILFKRFRRKEEK